MIDIKIVKGRYLISLWDLCKATSFNHQSHRHHNTRWLNTSIYPFAIHGHDYFRVKNNSLEEKMIRNPGDTSRTPKKEIYFSLDFSITLCYMMKSRKATRMRNYLIDIKKELEKKQSETSEIK